MATKKSRTPSTARTVPAKKAETSEMTTEVSESIDIDITAEPQKKINVNLVGRMYTIRRPKTALLMRMAVSAKKTKDKDAEEMYYMVTDLIGKTFGKTDAKEVQERLESSDDDLEYEHITALMQALTTYGTGNPSTSP